MWLSIHGGLLRVVYLLMVVRRWLLMDMRWMLMVRMLLLMILCLLRGNTLILVGRKREMLWMRPHGGRGVLSLVKGVVRRRGYSLICRVIHWDKLFLFIGRL